MSEAKERGSWNSRFTFILAAVGSAVGLGNAWRFPGLCAKYGGGAFLLVYLVMMLVMGIPLLMMEISIGRKAHRGAPNALKSMNKKFEFIGWCGTTNAFFIVTYYAVVFAWVILMTICCFKFGQITNTADAASQASSIWANEIGVGTGINHMSTLVIVCLFIAWGLIYYCIRNGAKSVGKVVKYTVFLPVICLVIMAIKGLTMSGAMEGMKALFVPKFASLSNPNLWVDAIGQVFYSLSIMMVIMIAYGSFLKDDANIAKDSMIIAFSDAGTSLLASIVMFSTMYGLNLEGNMTDSGIGTAFIVYPVAIVNLTTNGIVNGMFAFIFYFCLCTLAIDSAFSIVEGVATSVSDRLKLNKKKTTIFTCIIAGVISIIFATGKGLDYLDTVDHWCNAFNLILVGIAETIAIGWFFKTSKVLKEVNKNTKKFKMPSWWFEASIKVISPLLLSGLFIWNLVDLFRHGGIYGGYNVANNIVFGWMLTFLMILVCILYRFIIKHREKQVDLNDPSWDDIEDAECIATSEDVNEIEENDSNDDLEASAIEL